MAYFDRFDICEAYYSYFTDYHSGMWSLEYKRQSKMLKYFKPRPTLDSDNLTENGREIYDGLVRKYQS